MRKTTWPTCTCTCRPTCTCTCIYMYACSILWWLLLKMFIYRYYVCVYMNYNTYPWTELLYWIYWHPWRHWCGWYSIYNKCGVNILYSHTDRSPRTSSLSCVQIYSSGRTHPYSTRVQSRFCIYIDQSMLTKSGRSMYYISSHFFLCALPHQFGWAGTGPGPRTGLTS